jgi:hypothetical protein
MFVYNYFDISKSRYSNKSVTFNTKEVTNQLEGPTRLDWVNMSSMNNASTGSMATLPEIIKENMRVYMVGTYLEVIVTTIALLLGAYFWLRKPKKSTPQHYLQQLEDKCTNSELESNPELMRCSLTSAQSTEKIEKPVEYVEMTPAKAESPPPKRSSIINSVTTLKMALQKPSIETETKEEPEPEIISPPQTPTSPMSYSLDLEGFIVKLHTEGFDCERLKGGQVKPKTMKLNSKGELYWSKAWAKNPISLSLLQDSFVTDAKNSFILDFKGKTLHLRVQLKKNEYSNEIMAKYFKMLAKVMKKKPEYLKELIAISKKTYFEKTGRNIDDDRSSIASFTAEIPVSASTMNVMSAIPETKEDLIE